MDTTAVITLIVCFLFIFINGFHDGCNVIATAISSRSINPRKALLIGCFAEFSGSIVFGTGIAATIGRIVNLDVVREYYGKDFSFLFLSAIIGAILWNMLTWWFGMPSSSTHALVGGIIGGALSALGVKGINWDTVIFKVVMVLLTSPLIGFIIGYVCLKVVALVTRNRHPRVNRHLKGLQTISMFTLGMSQGSNDTQITMGIIAAIVFLSKYPGNFVVPLWVKLLSAVLIALGMKAGGWRIMKTTGFSIFNVKPIHSFCSQIASASIIITASLLGGPVSATQIMNSSIMGVGTAERKNAVHWGTVKSILISWVFTIPASAVTASLVFFLLKVV